MTNLDNTSWEANRARTSALQRRFNKVLETYGCGTVSAEWYHAKLDELKATAAEYGIEWGAVAGRCG